MYEDLTGVQIAILEYIKEELKKRNYPPSVREICASVGLNSTSSVHYQLNNLEKKGYLRRDPQKPRALAVVKEDSVNKFSESTIDVPVLGKVAAGTPIYAQEEYDEYIPLPLSFVSSNDCFILVIKGSSMINAGILDGDYVIVERRNYAEDGEIIVALIEDDATVKTYYKEKNMVRLQPENPMMAPIYTRDVKILGKVIGVLRRY